MSEAIAQFIGEATAIATPPLLPEIRLHMATEITPIWQATEATLEQTGLGPPYWAFCWAGGQALARHVLDNPALVAGRDVLDFASGCGVVAIAAARAGARSATACDIDQAAAVACRLNAALNAVEIEAITGELLAGPRTWDVILAGDVCYERPMTDAVLPALRARATGGATVLLGDPGRAYLPTFGLTRIAVYDVPTSREIEDREMRSTTIWRLGACPSNA